MNINKRLLGFFLLIALGIGGQSALANTAANSTIVSNVTLSYDQSPDALSAFALVTVNLVPSAALFATEPAASPAAVAEDGTPPSVTYTIFATANGPDTYTIATTGTRVCEDLDDDGARTCATYYSDAALSLELGYSGAELETPVAAPTFSVTTELGATVVVSSTGFATCTEAEATSTCVVTVANDNDAVTANVINGLATGDRVYIAAATESCSVTIVADGSATTGVVDGGTGLAEEAGATSTIKLHDCSNNIVSIGDGTVLGELQAFDLTFDPDANGALNLPESQTVSVATSVTNVDGDVTNSAFALEFTVEVIAALTIDKYVKNITEITYNGTCGVGSDVGNVGDGTLLADLGIDADALGNLGSGGSALISAPFCESAGVSADPADKLEYLIVIANNDGSNTSNLVVNEPIADFVNYDIDSVKWSLDGTNWFSNTDASTVAANDRVQASSDEIYFYPGTGGADNGAFGTGNGGSLSGEGYFLMIYTVTVQ